MAITQVLPNFTTMLADDDWSFKTENRAATTALTHSYHRYPAKFIPQIVDKLIIEHTKPGDLVVDPFGGCGTTLVEAKLLGRRSVGFDINPIAKLITQAKLTPIDPAKLEKSKQKFQKHYDNATIASVEHQSRISYWFDEKTIIELDRIYESIKSIKDSNIRRFYLCAFSHSLKNCSRWLMKSIKPTIDTNKVIPNPLDTFMTHLNSMIRKNKEFYAAIEAGNSLYTPATVYQTDSTKKWPIKNTSIDLIVTSPPYVTSYEYADLHQLSLLWFGDDPNHFKRWHNRFSKEFVEFRRNFIGTNSKAKKTGQYDSDLAADIVEQLLSKDKPLAEDVANYFIDMKKVFQRMYHALKPGGTAGVIIGNTTLQGVNIINAEVAAEQMIAAGFVKVDFIKREVTSKMITPWRDSITGKFTGLNNPTKRRIYEHEYVLIMERPKS